MIFPICDEQGRVIAFSGRVLTLAFQDGALLFNLHYDADVIGEQVKAYADSIGAPAQVDGPPAVKVEA